MIDHVCNEEAWHPLATAQRSRWVLYQFAPEQQGFHNNVFVATVHGDVSVEILSSALNRLFENHAMLRAYFRDVDGEPQQAIAESVERQVQLIDVGNIDDANLRQVLTHDSQQPFDLAQAPLVRANLYQRHEREPVLLLVFDHLICDGWSYWRILGELGELLGTLQNHTGSNKADADADYLRYVNWEREWLTGTEADKQWRYWNNKLAAPLPVLDLPYDRARSPGLLPRQLVRTVALSVELTLKIRELARVYRCTPYVVLLAAYQILLHRFTGQEDIVVGSPMPGRYDAQWDSTVGEFVNPIALRTLLSGNESVAEVLSSVRTCVLNSMSNQEIPFSKLVERLGLSGDTAEHPIFQTMFVFQKARGARSLPALWACRGEAQKVTWGPVELSSFPVHQSGGMHLFGLVLEVLEFDDHVRCDFKFDANAFDTSTIGRLSACFMELIESMVTDPLRKVGYLSLLPPVQSQQILIDFNATAMAYRQDALMHQLFEEQALRQPDAIAVVYEDQQLSYAQLNGRANQIAHHLLTLGIRPDDRVAICVERSFEMVAGLLGILKAGAAYVPLDPTYPQDRLAYMLADSAPRALLSQAPLRGVFPDLSIPYLELDTDASLAQQPEHNPDPQALGLNNAHLAYIIYTSGSTGQPKGVMIEHTHAMNFIAWASASFDPMQLSNTLFSTSINFDLAVYELFVPLSIGASVTLVNDILAHLPSPSTISLINTVPSAIAALLDADGVPASTVSLNLAGEPLKAALVERIFARTAIQRVANLYGPTETTTYSTWTKVAKGEAFPSHIGRPVANTQIYILDANSQQVPIGVAGEIYIGGAGVARGYLNRPELTAERFLADPFSSTAGARMYKTGDLGRWLADGNIEYLGRNDFQVKIRGFRIELGEIEARLLACNGVRDAVVLAREDQPGDKRLVAYLVTHDGITLTAASLRPQLAAHLAGYMVPSVFVFLPTLPLTPNGKVDRLALPTPDQSTLVSRAYEAPLGPVEELVAQTWQDLLKIDRVGRHDNFFELGGHSLLLPPMVSRLRQHGFAPDIRAIFHGLTPAELAMALMSSSDRTGKFSVPANRIPSFFGQTLEPTEGEEFTF